MYSGRSSQCCEIFLGKKELRGSVKKETNSTFASRNQIKIKSFLLTNFADLSRGFDSVPFWKHLAALEAARGGAFSVVYNGIRQEFFLSQRKLTCVRQDKNFQKKNPTPQ